MTKKEKPVKCRDWNAVDAHFRQGGPMKHKNTPRGGAKKNTEIEEALEELEDNTMGDINRRPIPTGYNHKATSESFNGMEKVIIYHSNTEEDYLVVFESQLNEDIDEEAAFVNKTQLELLVHAGTDVLDDLN